MYLYVTYKKPTTQLVFNFLCLNLNMLRIGHMLNKHIITNNNKYNNLYTNEICPH